MLGMLSLSAVSPVLKEKNMYTITIKFPLLTGLGFENVFLF